MVVLTLVLSVIAILLSIFAIACFVVLSREIIKILEWYADLAFVVRSICPKQPQNENPPEQPVN